MFEPERTTATLRPARRSRSRRRPANEAAPALVREVVRGAQHETDGVREGVRPFQDQRMAGAPPLILRRRSRRLHAEDLQARFQPAGGDEGAHRLRAAADRDDDRLHVRRLLEDLQAANVALPSTASVGTM
jgi:hypothetical protein